MPYIVSRILQTSATPEQVTEITDQALRSVGGVASRQENLIMINEGNNGVPLAILASFNAQVTIREVGPSQYEIQCIVNRKPSVVFWICLAVGLVFFPIWIANLLYFAANPTNAYQQALNQIASKGAAPGAPPSNVAVSTVPQQISRPVSSAPKPTQAATKRFIISVPSSDALAYAQRLEDQLLFDLPDAQIVLGVEKLIHPGDDFVEAIENGVKAADALLLLIGAQSSATNWLADPDNYNRIALETVLRERKRLVPILIEDALIPADIPEAFASLKRRQPIVLRNAAFMQDAKILTDTLKG